MAATGSQASSSASAILRAKDEANDLSGVASSSSAPFQSSAPNPNHQPQSSDGPGASSPGIATGSPWTHPPNYQQYPPPLYPTAPSLQKKASTSGDGPISQRNGSGSPGPASSKTKNGKTPQTIADAVAASVGNKKERKRKRIHYSCAECHRRKHKCDRQYPCGPCIDRGIGDSCRPFESGDEHGDYRDRISRLEDIVEALATAQTSLAKELTEARAAGQFKSTPSVAPVSNDHSEDKADDLTSPPRKLRPPSIRGMEREELFHAERRTEGIEEDEDGRKVPGSAVETNGNSLEGGLTTEGDAFFGALALPSVSRGAVETEINGQRLELGAHLPRFPASFKLARLVSEGGAAPTIVADLMDLLPPKKTTDDLLHLYFRDINTTRLPIHEGTFRQSYEALMAFKWGKAKEEVGDDGARHVPFLAFLFILLAIAKRNEPESISTEEQAKKGALFLYHACRKTIHVATYIRADHIDLVLAQMYAARFLITCRQSAESWNMLGSAIRAAQAIGLHRDGSKLGLDAATTERRRRLWSLLFYLDKSTSILLGRPPAIQTHHCDTMAPSDVDIDTMPRTAVAGPPKWAEPGTPPGVFNFVAIRHNLTIITGKIAEHFQNLASPRNYSDVVKLDQELEAFKASLPAQYQTDETLGTDKSFDEICPWLPLHRYLISVEYHYNRCTLHRPYLLRNSEKYTLSRNAAFASARADRRVRQAYRREVQWPKDRARKRHMGGLYRLFSSTLITGIELLLDPTGPDSAELMACLDEFIEKHNRRAEKDQCSKREVAIIELFRQKAKDPGWCARKGAKRATVTTSSRTGALPIATNEAGDTAAQSTVQAGSSTTNADPAKAVTKSEAPKIPEPRMNRPAPASTSLQSLNPATIFNQQELAQSIFDTLGGGIDQFGVPSALPTKPASNSAALVAPDGTYSFGGIAGPGMNLPEDLSGIASSSNSLYAGIWGHGDGQNGGNVTPTMAGQHSWTSASLQDVLGSSNNYAGDGSPASSGGGSGSNNLQNIDWSVDSLMPWGAMIEAITMQKPGQGNEQAGHDPSSYGRSE